MIQPIAIEKYCDVLKDRILFNRFNMEVFITGEAIRNLTPVPQINSFVLRSIFSKWKKETEKLKSPYFDYDHPDVKEALKEFLNKLSFQIKINKDYFEVILKEALHDAFEYLENPVFFLQTEIFDFKGNTLPYSEIKARSRFLKLYSKEIEIFLNHSKINQSEVRLDVLMKIIEEVFASVNKLEEEKSFVDQISKVVPNNFINLTETKPAVEKVEKKRNFIDDLEFEGIDLPFEDEEEQKPELTEKIIEEFESEGKKELELEIDKEDVHLIEEQEKVVVERVENKNQREIPKIELETITQLAPIESLNAGISLQQKFYFIKELFGMDENSYQSAVDNADTKETYDDACNYLWDRFSAKYHWVDKEEVVIELFSILNRKF